MPKSSEITRLLHESGDGDRKAMDELAAAVYHELHKIARAYMKRERKSHTLQPTALIGEAFLRLFQGGPVQWENRSHFYRVVAKVMRQVLLDHGRKKHAQKRGQAGIQVSFDDGIHGRAVPSWDVVALDEALTRLATVEPRLSQVVELRYFGGLDIEQTAEALQCSSGTVKRDWDKAKLWLKCELKK